MRTWVTVKSLHNAVQLALDNRKVGLKRVDLIRFRAAVAAQLFGMLSLYKLIVIQLEPLLPGIAT
jgi:hypothetical protein